MKYLVAIALSVIFSSLFAQEKLNRPDIPGEVMIDIGLNYLDDEPPTIDQKGWRSKSIAIYYTKMRKFNSNFALVGGLGFAMEKLSLGDTTTLFSHYQDDTEILPVAIKPLPDTDPAGVPLLSYRKNRLAMVYLEAPVEFRFYPMGTEEGEGPFVSVGGMLGLKLDSKTKWKYLRQGRKIVEKNSGKFNLNSIRYGVQIRLGIKGIHLFYKQYFRDLFENTEGIGVNPRMTTIGISLTGF